VRGGQHATCCRMLFCVLEAEGWEGPETLDARAGAHHVMLSVCMFFFCVGDAVSQAAQSFLPSVIGRPSASRRLGRQLMSTGVVVGAVNCALAGAPSTATCLCTSQ